ncbi:hypothetical protein QYF61_012801 [Mycteria americana]|uniref:Uncharacterized protein n=1 Tax=Mycteria americana TaxID=33587 RepID=A0AAN7S3E0_MYCAM|nr:hypothetical protein QYF61_012801 [Mycteria americana]
MEAYEHAQDPGRRLEEMSSEMSSACPGRERRRKLHRAVRPPLSLLLSKLDKPCVLSRSSEDMPSSPFPTFVAVLGMHSSTLTSVLNGGAQNRTQYSRRGHTNAEYSRIITSFDQLVMLEKTQKAKAQLELKLASVESDKKKAFFQYVDSKRRSKENTGLILVEDGHLTNRDEEKGEAFNAFFASVFNNTDRAWTAWSSELEDHDCRNSDFSFMDAETVRHQLYQLNIPKPMGPGGIHPRVLKELVDVTAGPLSIIYQRSWESGELLADWKLAKAIPIYKNRLRETPGNYRPVSLT